MSNSDSYALMRRNAWLSLQPVHNWMLQKARACMSFAARMAGFSMLGVRIVGVVACANVWAITFVESRLSFALGTTGMVGDYGRAVHINI